MTGLRWSEQTGQGHDRAADRSAVATPPAVERPMTQLARSMGNARASATFGRPPAAAPGRAPAGLQRAVRGTVARQLARLRFEDGNAEPALRADHGHLDDGHGNIDDSLRRDPTLSDRAAQLQGYAMLEGAELIRPDLVDGTRGFRHFLEGNGAPLTIEYDRYLANDASGQALLTQLQQDVRDGAIERDNAWMVANPAQPVPDHHFQMVSETFNPTYPATENWQKAIGGHLVWVTAEVDVTTDQATGQRHISVTYVIHMFDRYNFDPNKSDLASGQSDSVFGALELSGLGHEFDQRGESSPRTLSFDAPMTAQPGTGEGGDTETGREPRTPGAPSRTRRDRPDDPRTR